MTKQKTLENFLKSVIKDSVKILNEINSKEQLKLLQELQYEFKQDYFNKTTTVKKNDFGEFFSRKGLIQSLEKINDFDDVVDMISGYSNSKAYLARGIDAKNLIHLFIENYIIYANDFKFIESKFNDIFKSFLKFLDSEILKVRYFTPIFRLSFPSKYRQKELGEIRLTKINEEQLFYCNQRGLNQEEAVSLIVNGFCKEVLQQLPMEFAVEAQKLVSISLEGSVG